MRTVMVIVCVSMIWSGTANAWRFIGASTSAVGATAGNTCSDSGHKIVVCECADAMVGPLPGCQIGVDVNYTGCHLDPDGGKIAFCLPEQGSTNLCDVWCNCYQQYGSWSCKGGSTASPYECSRTVTQAVSNNYKCQNKTETEYSCRAGYYASGGGSSCTKCPGDNNVSATTDLSANMAGITSCYIPSKTSVADASGNYQYTSSCHYK